MTYVCDNMTWQIDMTYWHDNVTIVCVKVSYINIKVKRKKIYAKNRQSGGGGLNDFGFVYKVEWIYRGATLPPNIYNVLLCGH